MAEDVMLQEAIEAIRQGQRSRARDLLTRLLRTIQAHPGSVRRLLFNRDGTLLASLGEEGTIRLWGVSP